MKQSKQKVKVEKSPSLDKNSINPSNQKEAKVIELKGVHRYSLFLLVALITAFLATTIVNSKENQPDVLVVSAELIFIALICGAILLPIVKRVIDRRSRKKYA